MIKCKLDGCNKQIVCCRECSDNHDCEDRCDLDPNICGDSEFVETTELSLFQSTAMVVMRNIAELDRQKKMLETQDKNLRKELQEAMNKYGVKSFENDILKVTYVEPTTRTTIDSARLKKELPAVAEKYSKTTVVKGSVRIEVK